MPTIVAHHNIKDKAHWLASPKRKELFGPLGITNIRTFVDPQNPTRVAVLMDVPDMGALMSAMKTKAAADAMAYDDGVFPETLSSSSKRRSFVDPSSPPLIFARAA